jgi:hypothetical protein
MKIQS